MKNKVAISLALFFAAIFILLSTCGIKKNIFDDNKADQKSSSIIPKVAIAKACNVDQSNCLDNVLLFSGQITDLTMEELEEVVHTHPDVDITAVCFNSPGGDVWKAEIIAGKILEVGKPTCLAETYFLPDKKGKAIQQINTFCNSACNYLLLASNKRIALGAQFKFKTHSAGFSASFCFCDIPIGLRFVNSFLFKDMLKRKDNEDSKEHLEFLEMSNKVDFSTSYELTPADLQRYKIFSDWL